MSNSSTYSTAVKMPIPHLGFGKADQTGRANGGNYTIYDMFSTKKFDGERYQVTHPYWSIIATADKKEPFSYADLGKRLSNFSKQH
ncbi:hypothetical protein VTI28DRAFT_7336 [Corynascus sepedonium]